MSTASKTQKIEDNLFFTLFPSLKISVSTANQVNVEKVPENVTIEIVKEKYRQSGLHNLLLKPSLILLTLKRFTKSSADSIHFFLKLIGIYVKCPIKAADERQQHQASETSTTPEPTILSGKEDPLLSKQTFNELEDGNDI